MESDLTWGILVKRAQTLGGMRIQYESKVELFIKPEGMSCKDLLLNMYGSQKDSGLIQDWILDGSRISGKDMRLNLLKVSVRDGFVKNTEWELREGSGIGL